MGLLKNTWQALDAREKKQFRVLAFLDVLIHVADILSLALLLGIVQSYVQPRPSGHWAFLSSWMGNRSTAYLAVFFLLFSAKNLLAIFIARRQLHFSGEVAVRISALNLSYYQQAPFQEYIEVDSSVRIRTIAFQPFEFCQYLLTGIQQIITQSFLIALTLTAIILFNARLFLLLLLILLPPVAAVFYFIKKKLSVARSGIRTANERSFQYLLDALKGYVEARIYGRKDFFMKRFMVQRKQFSLHLFDALGIQAMPGRVIEVFAIMGLFLLIVLAANSGHEQDALLTVGAFLAAAYKVIPGVVKLINASGQMKAYELSLQELAREGEASAPAAAANVCVQSVCFRNVCFAYEGRPLLHHVNFHVERGDFAGIAGHSGKGKTTMLNLLLGFLPPAHGSILVNGCAANGPELRKYWPAIAYVRQQSFLINDTILKNITLQEEAPDEARLQEALHVSGLGSLLLQFPEGCGRMISENGKNISGGQQQRIALARALYKQAEVFLLDEPFNELDEASETILLQHFQALARAGKIVIMITHDRKSLSYCNQIISLDER